MNKLNLYHNHLHSHVGFIGNAELIVIVLYLHKDVCIHPRLTRTTWKIYANRYVFLFLKIIFLLVVICACKIFHINLWFRKGRTCRNKLSQLKIVCVQQECSRYLQQSRSRTMGMSCLSCHDNKTSRSKLKPVRQKIN